MYAQKQEDKTYKISGFIILYSLLNLFVIAVSMLSFYILFEAVVIAVVQKVYLYAILYAFHVIFTIYNFHFTFNWSKNVILELIFELMSFIISLYCLIIFIAILYWSFAVEQNPEYISIVVVFCFLFFWVPGIQTWTYRLLKRARDTQQKSQVQKETKEYVVVDYANEPYFKPMI